MTSLADKHVLVGVFIRQYKPCLVFSASLVWSLFSSQPRCLTSVTSPRPHNNSPWPQISPLMLWAVLVRLMQSTIYIGCQRPFFRWDMGDTEKPDLHLASVCHLSDKWPPAVKQVLTVLSQKVETAHGLYATTKPHAGGQGWHRGMKLFTLTLWALQVVH